MISSHIATDDNEATEKLYRELSNDLSDARYYLLLDAFRGILQKKIRRRRKLQDKGEIFLK